VLELRAIDLDAGASVAEERFRQSFDNPRLSGAGGTKKQQVSNRSARGIQSRQEHLVNFDHLFDGRVLTDNAAT
jgi:hypothetical protein